MSDAGSTTENRTLPRRLPNSAYRQREYLTENEVEKLIDAARKRGRNGQRDSGAILLAYRHGLRAAELCSLKWTQVDLKHGRLHVNRAKGGIESVHPLHGPELRALRQLKLRRYGGGNARGKRAFSHDREDVAARTGRCRASPRCQGLTVLPAARRRIR